MGIHQLLSNTENVAPGPPMVTRCLNINLWSLGVAVFLRETKGQVEEEEESV